MGSYVRECSYLDLAGRLAFYGSLSAVSFFYRAVMAWLARARLPSTNLSSCFASACSWAFAARALYSTLLIPPSVVVGLLPYLPRRAASRPLANETSTLAISATVAAFHLRRQSASWVAAHGCPGSSRWIRA